MEPATPRRGRATPNSLDFARLLTPYNRIRVRSTDKPDDNTYNLTLPWPEVEPDLPYAVLLTGPSGDWYYAVAIDLDTAKGNSHLDAADLCGRLERVGIDYVLVHSGPGGGIHVLLRLRSPAHATLMRLLAVALRAKYRSVDPAPMQSGRASAIRPPLSAHRRGGYSEIEGDINEALVTLRKGVAEHRFLDLLDDLEIRWWELAGDVPPTEHESRLRQRLTDQTCALLAAAPKTWGTDATPSGALRSALAALANAEVSFFDAWYLAAPLIDQSTRGPRGEVRKGRKDQQAFFAAEWRRAAHWVEANPALAAPIEFRVKAYELYEAAERFPWPPRSAPARRVLDAMLDIAVRSGRLQVRVSDRQLEAMTTLSIKTIGRARRRLEKLGWLQHGARGHFKKEGGLVGSEYLITEPLQVSELSPINFTPLHGGEGIATTDGEIAQLRRSSFGEAFANMGMSREVWLHLDPVEARSPAQLVAAIRCARSTVHTALERLRRAGFAERVDRGLYLRVDLSIEEIAERRGTTGLSDELRAKHAAERELFTKMERARRWPVAGDGCPDQSDAGS